MLAILQTIDVALGLTFIVVLVRDAAAEFGKLRKR